MHLINTLNGKIVHGNKIYCKGLSDLYTPEKEAGTEKSTVKAQSTNDAINVSPEKQTSPTIPGLHLSTPSKSKLRKMKKNKSKDTCQIISSNVNINEFEFENVEVESRENKRGRNSPQDDRRTRQKSECDLDLC